MDGQIILYRSVVQNVQLAFVRYNSLNMGCFLQTPEEAFHWAVDAPMSRAAIGICEVR